MRAVAFLYIAYLCGYTFARLVNTTIDDTYGDPETGAHITYSPAIAWNDGSKCQRKCTAKVDASKAYNSTWHDGTFALSNVTNPTPDSILSASVPFNGSAIYVYCIIGHTSTNPNANSDMVFLLDGQRAGNFTLKPTGSPDYDYDVPVYVNTSIPQGAHTLSIESGHSGKTSLVLLDYVTYSHEAEDQKLDQTPKETSGTSSNKTTIIVGATVGSIILILAVLAAIFFTRRYMRRRHGGPYLLDLGEQLPRHDPPTYSAGSTIQPGLDDSLHPDPFYTDEPETSAFDEPPTYAATMWVKGSSLSAVSQSSGTGDSTIHHQMHRTSSSVHLHVQNSTVSDNPT